MFLSNVSVLGEKILKNHKPPSMTPQSAALDQTNNHKQKEIIEPVSAFKSLSINQQSTHQQISPNQYRSPQPNYVNVFDRQLNKIQTQHKSQSLGNLSDASSLQERNSENGSVHSQLSRALQSARQPGTGQSTTQAERPQQRSTILGEILASSNSHLPQFVHRESAQPMNSNAWNVNSQLQPPRTGDSTSQQSSVDSQLNNQDYQQQLWRRSACEAL